MAKETSAHATCISCGWEIIYCGCEAPKEPLCSKCQKAKDEKSPKKKKADK